MKNIHRINDFALLKFIEMQDLMYFDVVNTELNLTNKHYIPFFEIPVTDTKIINNVIWESGDFIHTLNKIYSAPALFVPNQGTILRPELKFTNVHILLQQGFVWEGIFGIHLVIKNTKTDEILLSQNISINDFNITENRELIDGTFWLEEFVIPIPTVKDVMSCQVTIITFNDISNSTGLISNFPNEFILLVDEKPIPDFIKTILSFDENHFLKVQLKTDETKTLEQSLLDYFEVTSAVIEVSHVINYGNDLLGYASIRVSNEDNKYLPVIIGLNLYPYFDPLTQGAQLVNIFVYTEILVSNKLMVRSAQMNTDMSAINPFISGLITHPETNFPVAVTKTTNVTNTVIEAKESTKLISIFQPVFVETITDSITFDNKNIFFDKVQEPTYLKLLKSSKDAEQIILSDSTSDNKFYFDISKFVPIVEATKYELIDAVTMKVIGTGNVFIKVAP